MNTIIPEPISKKSTCVHCGDAPINHFASYFESIVSNTLDPVAMKVAVRAPVFIKRFVDWFPAFLLKLLSLFGGVSYSSDIDKSVSFRSRIIWEEARRRGIDMQQIIVFGKPIEQYRALLNNKWVYFESLPIPFHLRDYDEVWDDKALLKTKLSKKNIPVPRFIKLPVFGKTNTSHIFSKLTPPLVVKPRVGSRGRHTTTYITTPEQLRDAVKQAKIISPHVVAEEYLSGYVCRATLVQGELMGFFKGSAPSVVGDGVLSIRKLIEEKNSSRPDRVEAVPFSNEVLDHVKRFGYHVDDILPKDVELTLTYRTGRLFGGTTKEMREELHESFVPILEEAGKLIGLPVIGLDVIVPNPLESADSQRWGIIECNTLPFIDLHYYAFEGKPRNIAGKVWELWEKK